MTQTFIYVIYCPNKNEVKIGYAGNPVSRLLQLQTGTTDRLDLLMTFISGIAEEKELHTLLSEHRLAGEWFEYNGVVLATLSSSHSPTQRTSPSQRVLSSSAPRLLSDYILQA